MSIFPTAIFFSAVYSESLFLFLTVASFYYVRERRWLMAGVFGFFAALTRSEGVLLAVPMFIEWVIAAHEGGREFFRYWVDDVVKPLIGMALVPLGLAAYMAYWWVINGDPLRFSHVQSHWGRYFAPPWVSVSNTVHKIASRTPPRPSPTRPSSWRSPLLMSSCWRSASGGCGSRTWSTWRSRSSSRCAPRA